MTWKPVVGYEDLYEISSDGDVKRIGKSGGAVVGRTLKAWLNKRGYPCVSLYDGSNRKLPKKVHHLVLEAFVGPKLPNTECRHLDGNKTNNHVSNLRWGTQEENRLDNKRLGVSSRPKTINKGSKHPMSKLTEEKVVEIRRLLGKEKQKDIAKKFGISPSVISAIKCGRIWRS